MCGKVCPIGCPPQKTDMLDRYLCGFYICGMTLETVAELCSVTPDAVEKALKRYDMEAYSLERARRKEENGRRRRQKDRERKRTPEAREKDRERKRRKREDERTYVEAVRESLRDLEVIGVLRRAAREAGVAEEQLACARYLPGAVSVHHPCPGRAREAAEAMTPSEAGGRAEYEFRLIRGVMVGVPGPAVLLIREALDAGDQCLALRLAREEVQGAGFVNPFASVEDMRGGVTRTYLPEEVETLRESLVSDARTVATVPEPPALHELSREEKINVVRRWLAQARAVERDAERIWYGTCGIGKIGKQGGLRSAERGEAMSGMIRG